ncbi:YtzI protein [Pseudalkalibacillus hwajinpoensis]|uniref:YtzI protein n=1 Tax=Guptibacillus hwajinpoensis TaxID=208199 RepID=A0A4V5PY25_9BACL|nr:YtzI protein [Pseudalkalibacillus hwajinpoensis]TKD68298.1 YtzI protein [Pseudalkalibacillus hwajinpoensis]
MVITIMVIVVVIMTIVIAAAFGLAVSKGYNVKHTVDPLPEQMHNELTEKEVTHERTESK